MPLRAVFFDVGDTLVQHWKPQPEIRALTREALQREFGERPWYDTFLEAEIAPSAGTRLSDPDMPRVFEAKSGARGAISLSGG